MKRKPSRSAVTLLTCLLAVPTVPALIYNRDLTGNFETIKPFLLTGLVLGIAHIALRPVLRMISVPLGCLSFGLPGMIIDVGLIYLAAEFVDGMPTMEFFCALMTALVINVVCGLFAR